MQRLIVNLCHLKCESIATYPSNNFIVLGGRGEGGRYSLTIGFISNFPYKCEFNVSQAMAHHNAPFFLTG